MIKNLITKNIISENIKVNDLKVIDCQRIFDNICINYSDPITQYKLVNAIFNFAERNELIASNPFKKIDKTYIDKREKRERNFTMEQLQKFMQESKKEASEQWYVLYTLLVRTGI